MEFISYNHNPATGLKLFFVRHAESTTNNIVYNDDNFEEYKRLRFDDPELSLKGHEQA